MIPNRAQHHMFDLRLSLKIQIGKVGISAIKDFQKP